MRTCACFLRSPPVRTASRICLPLHLNTLTCTKVNILDESRRGFFSRSQFESEHLLKPFSLPPTPSAPPPPFFSLSQVHEHNLHGQVEFIYRATFLGGVCGVQIHQSASLRLPNTIAACFIQRLHFYSQSYTLILLVHMSGRNCLLFL